MAEIVRRDPRPHTLGYVAFLVATATTSAAEALATRIVALGGPAIGERLAEARARHGGPKSREVQAVVAERVVPVHREQPAGARGSDERQEAC